MKRDENHQNQKQFWEEAGERGYDEAIYAGGKTMEHILAKHWQAAVDTAHCLGLKEDSKILELGCGDGEFADKVLALQYKQIDACDFSESAINRARSLARTGRVNFFAQDITSYEFQQDDHWDGVYLMWILHHVKSFTPTIISRLAKVCPNIIVAEPNGNNIIRKILEFFPLYRRAGDESFLLKELIGIFEAAGYSVTTIRRVGFVPNYLPEGLLGLFKKLEAVIESTSVLNWLCSTNVIGFRKNLDN